MKPKLEEIIKGQQNLIESGIATEPVDRTPHGQAICPECAGPVKKYDSLTYGCKKSNCGKTYLNDEVGIYA